MADEAPAEAPASPPQSLRRSGREVKQPEKLQSKEAAQSEPFVIPKGAGTKLGDIPNVVKTLDRFRSSDQELKLCHRLCYKTPGSEKQRKAHLRQFSGCVEPEAAVRRRVESLKNIPELKAVARIFDCLPEEKEREPLANAVVKFLLKPADSGKPLQAGKSASKPSKRKSGAKKSGSRKPATKKAAKKAKAATKEKGGPKRALSSYFYFVKEQRPRVLHKYPNMTTTDIAKKISERWKRLDTEDKKPYEDEAKKDRQRYLREKEQWKAKAKKADKRGKKAAVDSSSEGEAEASEDEEPAAKKAAPKGKAKAEAPAKKDKVKDEAKAKAHGRPSKKAEAEEGDAEAEEKPHEGTPKKRKAEEPEAKKEHAKAEDKAHHEGSPKKRKVEADAAEGSPKKAKAAAPAAEPEPAAPAVDAVPDQAEASAAAAAAEE